MLRVGIRATFFIALSAANPTLAQTNPVDSATVSRVVNNCLHIVRNTRPEESWMQSYYANFDAFYNAATGTVQNNAQTSGDMKALFLFNNCMAGQGSPLR
jgi:hypothetical protein